MFGENIIVHTGRESADEELEPAHVILSGDWQCNGHCI
jgi:hypothetical protein